MATWLLQHTESKNALRFIGRAYHHKPIQTFVKQHHLEPEWALELATVFGGAAWELSQYRGLQPVSQLLIGLAGENALKTTQISSSLLKLFNLKDLLQQAH